MKNQIVAVIKYIALLIITISLGIWAIFYLIELSEQKNKADVPQEEIPPIINELPEITPPKPETKFIDLILPEDNYKISGNPYLPENYQSKHGCL